MYMIDYVVEIQEEYTSLEVCDDGVMDVLLLLAEEVEGHRVQRVRSGNTSSK